MRERDQISILVKKELHKCTTQVFASGPVENDNATKKSQIVLKSNT